MLQKANKQSVANALQRKANKQDLTSLDDKIVSVSHQLNDLHNSLPNFGEMSSRIVDLQQLCERQKDQFVELMRGEIAALNDKAEQGLKKSINKEIGKANSEIEGLQESLKRVITQTRETIDSNERRTEDTLKHVNSRIDSIQDLYK